MLVNTQTLKLLFRLYFQIFSFKINYLLFAYILNGENIEVGKKIRSQTLQFNCLVSGAHLNYAAER